MNPGQAAGDPGNCTGEGGRCFREESPGTLCVCGKVTGLTFATACGQIGRVETGTSTELANTRLGHLASRYSIGERLS